ncbi:hypothetical protein TPHA_0A02690 [Tetrapisispora phaffii CBS 4417]|uniref:Uncharacterized protein n=1 Tax=Tetrapisispora phaffii (strain ATCC 24235 / CBS 4417 / NBRC 1672 / NRRL Y-8282 / UCD 70-5) TaxID=1071381 RepID=G8BN73_TETPH|nr:hypothetical protein TPHA_0A02690 [Tetrapisispora phaffii CBS 4417]CCE61351.1 hypothetical protein TPHA_0A02690 [Tetrapisispora phaffii CBS 4417]
MIFKVLFFIFTLISFVLGDVEPYRPVKNSVFTPNNGIVSIEIDWIDNNAYPSMSKFSYFSFVLETGPNTNIHPVATLDSEIRLEDIDLSSSGTYSYTVSFPSSRTGDGQYYIQIYGFVEGEGSTIHYTPRFTLASMTGSTSYTYTDSTQPVPQTSIVTSTSTNSINSASFSIPYYSQSGVSRFAPMQTPPVSTVTATTWTRRFPTSGVTYYTSLSTKVVQQTTITAGWSGSVTSDVNYATRAAMPSDNGSWYNPSQRISLTPRKVNYRKI